MVDREGRAIAYKCPMAFVRIDAGFSQVNSFCSSAFVWARAASLHRALVLGWTAPFRQTTWQDEVVADLNEGAARGNDCSHRFGYVKECFSVAWR